MKTRFIYQFFIIFWALVGPIPTTADHLIILATNDTHSQIEPTEKDNMGGVFRRRAIFDDVRANNKNVLVVDAGDAVQGTIYYNLFDGELEYALLDSLGYDLSILGHHDFDNGLEGLEKHYRNTMVTKLSSNYDFTGTALEGVLQPYIIRDYGSKRVGIFGINKNPEVLMSRSNYAGMKYNPCEIVADSIARHLKEKEHVDFTVMISSIGYDSFASNEPCDKTIAESSHYIDLIIGGCSHTDIVPGSPESLIKNADGRVVTIGQNGKSGKHIGCYDINLDSLTITYDRIAVDNKWDNKANYRAFTNWTNRYTVEKMLQQLIPIGYFSDYFDNRDTPTWLHHANFEIAHNIFGIKDVTISIVNAGGIRVTIPKGFITYERLLMAFPFDNHYQIFEVKGKKVKELLNSKAHDIGAINVSSSVPGQLKRIQDNKLYNIITLDYLAAGGDFMPDLNHEKLLFSDEEYTIGARLIDYVIRNTIAHEIINAQ